MSISEFVNLPICQFVDLPISKDKHPPVPLQRGRCEGQCTRKKICFFVYRLDIYDLLHTRLRQLVDFFSLILYRSYIVPISKVKGRYIQKIFLISTAFAFKVLKVFLYTLVHRGLQHVSLFWNLCMFAHHLVGRLQICK